MSLNQNETPERDSLESSVQVEQTKPDFTRFVAIDTETTGLDPVSGEIIELGAVRFINGREVESFGELVKPEFGLPERNRRLTGIDPTMLVGARALPMALESFKEFVGDDLLVLHNAEFDTKFLSRLFSQARPYPSFKFRTLHSASCGDDQSAVAFASAWSAGRAMGCRGRGNASRGRRCSRDRSSSFETYGRAPDLVAQFSSDLASYRGKSVDLLFDLLQHLAGDIPSCANLRLGDMVFERLKTGKSEILPPFARSPLIQDSGDLAKKDPILDGEIREGFKRGGTTIIDDFRCGTGATMYSVPDDFPD